MEEVDWAMQHSGGRKLQHTICKLSLAAVLYLLWIERNRRWFQGSGAREVICKKDCDIRACINSWKHIRKLMRIGLSEISGRYSTKCLALDFSSLTSKARSVSSCFVNL